MRVALISAQAGNEATPVSRKVTLVDTTPPTLKLLSTLEDEGEKQDRGDEIVAIGGEVKDANGEPATYADPGTF